MAQTFKRFGADPPYKSPLLEPGTGRISLTWLQWFTTTVAGGRNIIAQYAYDPPSIASLQSIQAVMTVTGAAVGDFATASFDQMQAGIALSAAVTAANQVTVTFTNISGGAIDLASGTLRARVERNP